MTAWTALSFTVREIYVSARSPRGGFARCGCLVKGCMRARFDGRACVLSMRAEDGGGISRTLALGPLLLLFSGGRLFDC